MSGKFDFKKEYKDLYLPGTQPVLIDVPTMKYTCRTRVKQIRKSSGLCYAIPWPTKLTEQNRQ